MVIIEPFVYQKTTAFKERVQIISKLNEIINVFNDARLDDFAQYVTETNERLDNFAQTISQYYTKEEIDELINNIDLDNYYNKSEIDTFITTINNSFANYYTKTEINNKLDEVYDELNSKQNTLIAGSNVSITDDVISATGGYNFKFKSSYPNSGYQRKIRYNIYKVDMSVPPVSFFIVEGPNTYVNKQWDFLVSEQIDATNNKITLTYIHFITTGQTKISEKTTVIDLVNGTVTSSIAEKNTAYNINNVSSSTDYYVECYIDNNYPSPSY